MNDALLNFSLGIAGGSGPRELTQIIHTDEENVLNPAISQVIQHADSELGGFVFVHPHAQYILITIQIHADDHVGRFVRNGPILLHLEVGRSM